MEAACSSFQPAVLHPRPEVKRGRVRLYRPIGRSSARGQVSRRPFRVSDTHDCTHGHRPARVSLATQLPMFHPGIHRRYHASRRARYFFRGFPRVLQLVDTRARARASPRVALCSLVLQQLPRWEKFDFTRLASYKYLGTGSRTFSNFIFSRRDFQIK